MKADFKIKIGGEAPSSMKEGDIILINKYYEADTIFAPTFEVSEGSKVFVNGKEQISGVSEQDFLNAITYKIIDKEGKERIYKIAVNYISNDFKVTPQGAISGTNTLLTTAVIGEYMNGVRVTEIAEGGFISYIYTPKLRLPNSLKTIGDYAFAYCIELEELNLPSLVEHIGSYAFKDCSRLTGAFIIPSSVTFIGDATFYGCRGFTGNLNIPNSVKYIGDGAFWDCRGFTGNLNIPNSVKTIGDCAFAYCENLTGDLTLSSSETTIGDNAFKGSQITLKK